MRRRPVWVVYLKVPGRVGRPEGVTSEYPNNYVRSVLNTRGIHGGRIVLCFFRVNLPVFSECSDTA